MHHFAKFDFDGIKARVLCVDVYDGDTITIKAGIQPLMRKHDPNLISNGSIYLRCRMLGYNSAEMKPRGKDEDLKLEEKKKALESKHKMEELLLNKEFDCEFHQNDMYGRALIRARIGDLDVNSYMISGGYGMPYDGKGEKKW